MSYTFTFPADTKDVIDAIRDAIGREITFLVPCKTPCPTCILDPVTDESKDPFCTTCGGEGYLTTYSGILIKAHVTVGPIQHLGWSEGGQFYTGNCLAQIEYTIYNDGVVDTCKRVLVDNVHYTIDNKMIRGTPIPNRILLNLVEEEE